MKNPSDTTSSSKTPVEVPEAIKKQAREQFELIARGVAEIVPEAELISKLERSLMERRPLRIKLGVDPSTPDLHLGHTVVLQKLKTFQDLGHQVLFLIGDFTAQIGDPTGKSETRKVLTREDTARNANTYSEQVLKILNPSKTQIVFNSQWIDGLKIQDVIRLAAQMTVARMLERDDFSKRYQSQQPIAIHEFLYPILQAYDSVQLRADVELGGTDQKFNILLGREYQKNAGQEPQVAIFVKLLEGTDGVQKMSKSLGNSIGITESPKDIFGKIMSISDGLMLRYYELLTDASMDEVKAMHPRDAKVKLATELVSRFYSQEEADRAAEEFDSVFSKKQIPSDLPVVVIQAEQITLTKLMSENNLVDSLSEARRMIVQGAVSIDGEKISDTAYVIEGVSECLVKVGKRKFLQVKFRPKKP
jgi:tyrosyl-tRNA synthetase